MKILKRIVGVLSLVIAYEVMSMARLAAFGDALLTGGSGTSGSSATMVSLLLLVAGILAIIFAKKQWANIACMVLYVLAGIVGITTKGVYQDLIIWGFVSIVFAIPFLISFFKERKAKDAPSDPIQEELVEKQVAK